jgi:hypothetical protein
VAFLPGFPANGFGEFREPEYPCLAELPRTERVSSMNAHTGKVEKEAACNAHKFCRYVSRNEGLWSHGRISWLSQVGNPVGDHLTALAGGRTCLPLRGYLLSPEGRDGKSGDDAAA